MKRFLLTTFAVVFLSMISFTTTAFADDLKVGVINIQDLMQKLPQMKAISADMKKQFADREKKVKDAQNTLKKEAEDFKRNNAVMAAKEKQSAEGKLIKQEQELQQMQVSFQREYMAAQNKEINDLLTKVRAVVAKIAKQKNLKLVFVNAGLAYSEDNLDITEEVLKGMK